MWRVAPPALTDGHVTLRSPEPRDLRAIDAGMNDPDVVRWIGPAWPIDEFLPRIEGMRAAGSPTLAICEPDGACVGLVWVNVRDPDTSIGSVGYWLLPAARGRGYATSAVRLISGWAVEHLGLTTVRLRTAPDNERSQRVAERSGFRRLAAPPAEPNDRHDSRDVVFELDTTRTDRLAP